MEISLFIFGRRGGQNEKIFPLSGASALSSAGSAVGSFIFVIFLLDD
jgi:hypothetical protein